MRGRSTMLDGMGRLRALAAASVLALAALAASQAGAGPGPGTASTPPQTSITVWATPSGATAYNAYAQYGGYGYGGYTPMAGALITERREVDVGQTGEVRVTGIASTVDPATVQLR